MTTFLEEQVITGSGTAALGSTGSAGQWETVVLQLELTDVGGEADDTLDLYIQSSTDGGTTWDDFIHFNQLTGASSPATELAIWSGIVAPEDEMHAPVDAAMAVGVLQGPMGHTWRAKWVVASTEVDEEQTLTITSGADVGDTMDIVLDPGTEAISLNEVDVETTAGALQTLVDAACAGVTGYVAGDIDVSLVGGPGNGGVFTFVFGGTAFGGRDIDVLTAVAGAVDTNGDLVLTPATSVAGSSSASFTIQLIGEVQVRGR